MFDPGWLCAPSLATGIALGFSNPFHGPRSKSRPERWERDPLHKGTSANPNTNPDRHCPLKALVIDQ